MPSLGTAVALFLLAAALGLLLTRAARNVAARVGMVDPPDGHRKKQTRPVPVAGGVAVLAASLIALVTVSLGSPAVGDALTAHPRQTAALLAAAVVIALVGVADDRFNLRARYKLLGQVAAILVLILAGDLVIPGTRVFGWNIEFGPCAIPFTVLWLLGCVNALNLIDGMDGLLGTVGGIALVTLAVIAALTGNVFAAAVALALAGAVFGFLWWNLPPATVYMGDAGSMLIGLVIGAVSIPASLKGPATVALGAPLAVLILPAFDTAAAVVRRRLTGRGLATPDRGHLHHKLMERGLTPSRALMVLAVLGLVAAGGALATTAWNNDLFAILAAGGVVLALVVGKLFGNAELGLIRARVSAFVRGMWPVLGDARAWGLSVRLQGTADWDRVWGELVARAEAMNLCGLGLDVNAPSMHENFHARWTGPAVVREDRLLRLAIPLTGIDGTSLGQLTLAMGRDDRPLAEVLTRLAGLVELVEQRAATLNTPAAARPDPKPAVSTAPAPAKA